jgi:hypothetical protein
MKMTVKLVVAAFLLLPCKYMAAQNSDPDKVRPAQITFAYPLGSNGINSMDYVNNFSLNILYGLNGGVAGAEMGSIINFNRWDVKGLQMAGVSNINSGYTNGIQMAGVVNFNRGETKGIQLAGVVNFNVNPTKGIQAGTSNFVLSDFTGFQLGVINFSESLKGIQLGVINILGNPDGALPVGIFSIVKNGHYELEVTGGEVLYLNLNYKMGIDWFYTIFKAGYSYYNQEPVYSLGLGFGGIVNLAGTSTLSIDASGNQIVYKNDWPDEKENQLYKLDMNYRYGITKNLSILAGPSFNLYLTQKIFDNKYGTLNLPYHIFTNETSDAGTKSYFWIGANGGLSFKF